ncbi:MAG: glutamine--fructose-6-phosphate transaminase (isomerizing) [Euryhalocaulis sp.]|uniref:glutamine--fructose-6-phosphate transaminase (isomerizing) n=1 Tax=Euryhalocaulis sp. TaxID=2744307 RepID=UPI0017D75528|nr:glutamine--fructose-6-phosphate transaminase (isomerizing) [Euryhalocaulis sp.]MBA4801820.1 glutamine--fructose-6-phosphate transaminase (isomerizing) [Euryhalocaulis sp.]
MCGIIGIVGDKPVAERLLDGLRRLEYRGYDSAGLAVLDDGKAARRRAAGKIKALESAFEADPVDAHIGIAHTRWATHGAPNETNAHPHRAGRVTVIHNGIIENFRELKDELHAKGRTFVTQTDSEAVAVLVDQAMDEGMTPREAVQGALSRLEGAFALVFLFDGEDDLLIGARRGSPLVVGLGDGETYLGSDAMAVGPLTRRVIYLKEGDWAVATRAGATVYDENNQEVTRPVALLEANQAVAAKGNHRHFMEKEIYEQPEVVARTLSAYVNEDLTISLRDGLDFSQYSRVLITACGTASFAGEIARYWFEQVAKLPVEVDIASEFRYREPALDTGALALFISQSGETADTLAALRYCKEAGLTTAALVNVPESSIAREADIVLPTLAGPEIGVASTKAFTCQLAALAALAVAAGAQRGALSKDEAAAHARSLMHAPHLMNKALESETDIQAMAQELSRARDVLYLGRGVYFPLALEGALKLKEISYIHAEGYAAGELKHGPIALIEDGTPVIVIAPHDKLFDKTASNMQEVAARGARLVLISDEKGLKEAADLEPAGIAAPEADPLIAPIVHAVPVQLLAYHVAVEKGTDVDQPRNLAKSVTVE